MRSTIPPRAPIQPWTWLQCLLLVWLVGWSPHAIADRPDREPSEQAHREPSLNEIRRAALRYAGLDRYPERAWARRSRLAGIMPVLTVNAGRDLARDADLSRASNGTERLNIATDEDVKLSARAVWRLDRLLFDDIEVRAAQIAQQRHRERLELLARVTSLYYQRRKLQLAQHGQARGDGAAAQMLAIEEITDQLDALTGGYFRRSMRFMRD